MKTAIHPQWNHQATITCSCGNTFQTGSTLDSIQVEVCSACHPFYTGQMKFIDLQGRVDKFIHKRQAAVSYVSKKNKKKQVKQQKRVLSLRELLELEKKKSANTSSETSM